MNVGSPSTEPGASSEVDAVMEETDEALESGQEEKRRGFLVCKSICSCLLLHQHSFWCFSSKLVLLACVLKSCMWFTSRGSNLSFMCFALSLFLGQVFIYLIIILFYFLSKSSTLSNFLEICVVALFRSFYLYMYSRLVDTVLVYGAVCSHDFWWMCFRNVMWDVKWMSRKEILFGVPASGASGCGIFNLLLAMASLFRYTKSFVF